MQKRSSAYPPQPRRSRLRSPSRGLVQGLTWIDPAVNVPFDPPPPNAGDRIAPQPRMPNCRNTMFQQNSVSPLTRAQDRRPHNTNTHWKRRGKSHQVTGMLS